MPIISTARNLERVVLVLKRTFFGLACVLAISLLFTPRAHAAGTDNAARAAIVVHPETGAVLYEKNADERLGIATTIISKIPIRISSGKQRWIRQKRLVLEQESMN